MAVPKHSVPAERGAEPIGVGYDLTATDSDGNTITTFLRNVTVLIRYTDAQLAALGISEDNVVAKYWDSTTSTWRTPDNVIQDRENNTFSISTNHFTTFAGVETVFAGVESVGPTTVYLPMVFKAYTVGW